jgi:hypothetical protein
MNCLIFRLLPNNVRIFCNQKETFKIKKQNFLVTCTRNNTVTHTFSLALNTIQVRVIKSDEL